MKKNKADGYVIDWIILGLCSVLLMIGFHWVYDVFPRTPRFVAALLILFLIPIFWGILFYSSKGKKTIGNRIAEKINRE